MKTTADYLDALRIKYRIRFDSGLAEMLGEHNQPMKPQQINRYRKLHVAFGEELSVKVADLLEIPRGEVLLDMQFQRETNPEIKRVWGDLITSLSAASAVAAVLAVVAVLPIGMEIMGISGTAQHAGSPALLGFVAESSPTMYIMSNNVHLHAAGIDLTFIPHLIKYLHPTPNGYNPL